MRDFAQTRTLVLAAPAALLSASLCYPRLAAWPTRQDALWYLEAAILGCTAVLWGFVFAWHTLYTERPVFTVRISPKWFGIATMAGVVIAASFYVLVDPTLRRLVPEDYPANAQDWLARFLFGLGLTQLFVLYAPFDWLMRLGKNEKVATAGTIAFGVAIVVMNIHSEKVALGPWMVLAQILGRIVSSYVAIQLYLRGGLLLVCWFTVLLQLRLLLNLP